MSAGAMDPGELARVRKIIEKSTSKVSLRDLEKKGFRKVKVLRSNDIDQMIRRAVETALSSGTEDRERLVASTKKALKEQMAQAKQTNSELNELRGHAETALKRARAAENRVIELEMALDQAKSGTNNAAVQQLASERAKGQQFQAQLEGAQATERQAKQALSEVEERLRRFEERERDHDRAESTLRRRLEEAEARAMGAESRAATAENRIQQVGALQQELMEARTALKQAETEKRLTEELEIPRLRARIQELEAQGSGGQTVDPNTMRNVLRELLQEQGMTGGGGNQQTAASLQRLERLLGDMGRGKDSAGVSAADEEAMKVSLAALFSHEKDTALETNIESVQLREKTTSGVKSNLSRLKSMRKKAE
ncbi:MAG: hypothetical protein ACYS22_07740 [Planctomycetota bacterium]